MSEFFLALDQGTTGSTAALIDASTFELVAKVNQEFPQIFPKPSWVEHNLDDIWQSIADTVKTVMNKHGVTGAQIKCIGITNQRETTCAFNRKGEALANAIVWQDRRTTEKCLSLKHYENDVIKLTGLPIDPYFSGTKMNWLLNHNEKVQEASKANDLLFGTVDSFMLYRLSNGKSHATDSTNASRTLLMDLQTCNWSDELLNIFEVPKDTLPQIKESFGDFGFTDGLSFLPDGIPITCILGDQQAALFGQAGFNKGDVKCTYGTGAFMLLNIGNEIAYSSNKLLTTVAYSYQGKTAYAFEGSCYIAGAAVQWLRDNLMFFNDASEVEQHANEVKNLEEMENIIFMPFFSGIASPHWKPDAKAAILGMTRDTNKSHISRACLEGIALSIDDLVQAMKKDCDFDLTEMRVDGGAVTNQLLLQIQASFSEMKIIRPKVIETTAYGAALGSAIGAGFASFSEVTKNWKEDQSIAPASDWNDYSTKKKNLWKKSIIKSYS